MPSILLLEKIPRNFRRNLLTITNPKKPQKTNQADYCIKTFEDEVINQKLKIIGWRDVPVNSKVVGSIASKSQPIIKQVFITKENDNQNEKDPAYKRGGRSSYKKMSDDFENSIAFSAACDLVFKGRFQPSGYTEPLLHKKRLERKSA